LTDSPDYSDIRFQVEPSFVKAIQFAVGEGLIERLGNSRVKITDKGKQFATDILESDCLSEEKAFLKEVSFRLTEEWVVGFGMRSKAA
jgi:Mn-dependent DtxR family transcriptional regulator